MANICVIIPMFNYPDMTRDCIDITIKNAGVPIDIVVVDDGSDEEFDDGRVKVIRKDTNSGFTDTINTGIKAVWNDYKYIHVLNNDTAPYPNFISTLVAVFDKDKDVGFASSAREVLIDGKKIIEYWPVDIIAGWAMYSDEEMKEEYYHCPWAPLCSMLIRADVIRQVGLLDRRMINHCSDNDICIRAGILGYKTVVVPKSKVFHIHEVTIKNVMWDHAGDQRILLDKIECKYLREIVNNFPLDGESKQRGCITFTTYDNAN